MKKLEEMKPDEVCGWIQKQIRKLFGDKVENGSTVYARNGYYFIHLGKRRARVLSGPMRRAQVASWLKSQVVV